MQMQKSVKFVKKNLKKNCLKDIVKSEIIAIILENHLIIMIMNHYDYHLIIKELAEEFKKQFICSGENTGKYMTFTVSINNKLQELIKM